MSKHGIRYATATLLMRGGRSLKMASIINNWCDEKLLEVLKSRVEESRTLGLKLAFKYCTKSDTIIDVIIHKACGRI
jgi:hypothetical protein